MRKITKMSLEQLAQELPSVSLTEQMLLFGGIDPDRDCFWRCMAYLTYGLEGTSPESAMGIARTCLGDGFNEEDYAFSGNAADARRVTTDFFNALSYNVTGSIAVFNWNCILGEQEGGNEMHAMILTRTDSNYYYLYDPQTNENHAYSREDLEDEEYGNYVIRVNNTNRPQ